MAEDTSVISVVEKAARESQIEKSLKERFGVVRKIYSKDRKYIVFAHDRASGVTREDVYAYEEQNGEWVLIGMVGASRRACSSVVVDGKSVEVSDNKGGLIARFARLQ